MKRFIFVIVLTLTVAAGASGASTRSAASTPSKPVLLVCTSTAALNYAWASSFSRMVRRTASRCSTTCPAAPSSLMVKHPRRLVRRLPAIFST